MHVHYINLRRRTDRNDRFLELNRALVDVERIDAVDGRDIERDELARDGVMEGPMRGLHTGVVGKYLVAQETLGTLRGGRSAPDDRGR